MVRLALTGLGTLTFELPSSAWKYVCEYVSPIDNPLITP